ncbi:hypothetical protein CEXT_105721 [Caerostris extrusa]|uniref:Uncharacterized protein n=1 Tax=Caerostris extrusa TaxID=172846 RepID=A0AAV4P6Q4_CAEEX|nr:hypothetical protein CEXT_105721 [Caerostris extrusa]
MHLVLGGLDALHPNGVYIAVNAVHLLSGYACRYWTRLPQALTFPLRKYTACLCFGNRTRLTALHVVLPPCQHGITVCFGSDRAREINE